MCDTFGRQIGRPVFPVRREDLFTYDAVIFGDVNPALLSATALIESGRFRRAKRGRVGDDRRPALRSACLSRHSARSIGAHRSFHRNRSRPKAIDHRWVFNPSDNRRIERANMQLGNTLKETAQIWKTLPPLYWLLEAVPKESAEVLAEHPARHGPDGRPLPVILQRRAGAGMVLFHATDETWRWRFQVGDVFFARYWVQTIRYLSRTKLLGNDQLAGLTANRKQFDQGEPVHLRLEFTDPRQSPAEGRDITVCCAMAAGPNGN